MKKYTVYIGLIESKDSVVVEHSIQEVKDIADKMFDAYSIVNCVVRYDGEEEPSCQIQIIDDKEDIDLVLKKQIQAMARKVKSALNQWEVWIDIQNIELFKI